MKFAIRDDDTCYFTTPEELQQAYDFIPEGPISLSIVPNTFPAHKDDVFPYGRDIPERYYSVEENPALIEYLRQNADRYDILLHGHTHEYRKVDGVWRPEMLWKEESVIREETEAGKALLERLLGRKITVFVAPNNGIDARGIHAAERLGMDYSGIIEHRDRDVSARYLCNYVRRWTYRAFHGRGAQIPGVLNYGKHKEMVAYEVGNYDRLRQEYEQCKKRNVPFSVYTHYWYLNSHPETKALLRRIYEYVTQDGAQLVSLSSCFA